jgi:aminoglycoside phosphotransferase (APT) family kinase protein
MSEARGGGRAQGFDVVGDLTERVRTLLEAEVGKVVSITDVRPMFGGNGRKAWAFDVVWKRTTRPAPCVMLSQVGGRQVSSSIKSEFAVLSNLQGKGVRAPSAIAIDASGGIIGTPSIILERLNGTANVVSFLDPKNAILSKSVSQDLVDVVAGLHSTTIDRRLFDPTAGDLSAAEIIERQIDFWRDAFLARRIEPNPVMWTSFGWLKRNLVPPDDICLVHGDLRPGNFLYLDKSVSGLLDWEMAHLGDPLEDIAWIYRPLWSPKAFLRLDEFIVMYESLTKGTVDRHRLIYYRIFSEIKFATISLTASESFAAGRTMNLRHADRQSKVPGCLRRALDWIGAYERGG